MKDTKYVYSESYVTCLTNGWKKIECVAGVNKGVISYRTQNGRGLMPDEWENHPEALQLKRQKIIDKL